MASIAFFKKDGVGWVFTACGGLAHFDKFAVCAVLEQRAASEYRNPLRARCNNFACPLGIRTADHGCDVVAATSLIGKINHLVDGVCVDAAAYHQCHFLGAQIAV